jgi:hypothetical protein
VAHTPTLSVFSHFFNRKMPRGHGASPKVKAADARLGQLQAQVMSTVTRTEARKSTNRTAAGAPWTTSIEEIATLSRDSVHDLLDTLLTGAPLVGEDKKRCIAGLERLEDIWSSGHEDDKSTVPDAARSISAAAIAMYAVSREASWHVASKNGPGSHLFGAFPTAQEDRQLFGFGCMLLSSVIDSLESEEPAELIRTLETADETAGRRVQVERLPMERTIAFNLRQLNSSTKATPRVDLSLLVMRALQSLVTARAAVPDAQRLLVLLDSDALNAAVQTAELFPESNQIQSSLVGLLSAASGPTPDMIALDGVCAAARPRGCLCDELVQLGSLPSLARIISTFTADVALMMSATDLLSALTRTEGGRATARDCGVLSALDSLMGAHGADDALQREMAVLRAYIRSDDLGDMLSELGVADKVGLPHGAADAEELLAQLLHPNRSASAADGDGDAGGVGDGVESGDAVQSGARGGELGGERDQDGTDEAMMPHVRYAYGGASTEAGEAFYFY